MAGTLGGFFCWIRPLNAATVRHDVRQGMENSFINEDKNSSEKSLVVSFCEKSRLDFIKLFFYLVFRKTTKIASEIARGFVLVL